MPGDGVVGFTGSPLSCDRVDGEIVDGWQRAGESYGWNSSDADQTLYLLRRNEVVNKCKDIESQGRRDRRAASRLGFDHRGWEWTGSQPIAMARRRRSWVARWRTPLRHRARPRRRPGLPLSMVTSAICLRHSSPRTRASLSLKNLKRSTSTSTIESGVVLGWRAAIPRRGTLQSVGGWQFR
jgi:hypothetical protein